MADWKETYNDAVNQTLYDYNETRRLIDPDTTEGLKQVREAMIEAYTPNKLLAQKSFKAICLRQLDTVIVEKEGDSQQGGHILRVKARIPEIHSFLPIPTGPDDYTTLAFYPTFISPAGPMGEQVITPGSPIQVSFGNMTNFADPIFEGVYDIGSTTDSDSGAPNAPSSKESYDVNGRPAPAGGPAACESPCYVGVHEPYTGERIAWKRVETTKYKKGYGGLTLRKDSAERLQKVIAIVESYGGIITSSGGRRGLGAAVSPTRSKTSLHYTGRAMDLYLGSGMKDPKIDPYVIVLDESSPSGRLFRVYVAVDDGPQITLDAWTYKTPLTNKKVTVTRKLRDLTAIFKKHGFSRIPAMRSFMEKGNRLGAEWWHFQDITNLKRGTSTLGDELQKVWATSTLIKSPVWAYRNYVWKSYGFGK